MMNFGQKIAPSLFLTVILGGVAFAQVVEIPDPNLRAVIREELNIADRPEVRLDARMLRRLRSLYGFNRGISDLTGLEHATSLMHLSLHVNEISDVRPLAPLVKLTHIRIHNNQIEDVSPLGNLTALETLLLGSNKITDVRPLGNLIRLTTLMLDRNKIVDISALGNLVNLDDVSLVNNRIVDHSPVLQLSIANLEYDQTCDMPPLPLLPRLENRSFPSIVAPIGGILNRPDLSGVERLAYHDLYFCCLMFGHRFFNTGSGWQVRGDYDTAVRSRDNVLAHNPNMIFIAEVRMQNEGGGYPLPDSPDWVWLRDSQGSLVYQGERRVINFTHPQVKEMIVEQANAVSKCGLYDGIFLDWWNEYDPTLGDSIDNQIQQQARDDIIQRIRATTRPDFLILGNTNRRKTPRNAPHINGGFMETLVPRDASAGHVETLLAEVESSLAWLETHLREPRINSLEGWAVPTESLDSPTNLRWMRAFTTLSLTHSDGYVVFTRGGGHNHYWYDFWDAELGRPVGEKGQLYQETDGLYIREFTNGWAVYNHSGTPQIITLPEEVQGVASGLVGTEHTLPNLDGEIYLRVKPANPADVNGDGVVNILDLVVVAQRLGTDDPEADVNKDGVVNILDLVQVAGALGGGAAAPSAYFLDPSIISAADVERWLAHAQGLGVGDANFQRGIRFLQQLLAALTPKETTLLPNYPNPFNPETWIPYHLAREVEVAITIYDTKGTLVRRLALGNQSAGYYAERGKAAYWDGRNGSGESVASGIYVYQFRAGDYAASRRMVIVK